MNILFATFANPASEWNFYEKAFRKIGNVLSFGPVFSNNDLQYSKNLMEEKYEFITAESIGRYHQALKNNFFKPDIITNVGALE